VKGLYNLIILLNLLYCTVAIDIRNVDTNNRTLQIYINNDVPIGGFEFDLIGVDIDSVFGGSSELAEYTILTNGNKIMGYSAIGDSIPPGESILCNIKMNEMGYLICFDEFATITDPLGYEIEAVWGECADCSESIQFDNCGMCNGDNSICSGCIYEMACNYNAAAIVDDGSCVFVDGVCETCVDGTIVNNDADDDTVCDDMEIIGCQEEAACNYDVTATDSGDCNFLDCADCAGVPNGDSELDNCNVCDDNPANDCIQDCSGEWGGNASIITYYIDLDGDGLGAGSELFFCSTYILDSLFVTNNNDNEPNCYTNDTDECGVCGGSGIVEGICDCDGNTPIDLWGSDNYDCSGADLSVFNGLIPEDFSIHSIYPNPFNPVTSITYGLPENTAVHITVYDLGGTQITTLVRSFQIAGYHTIKWDASSYPSGVYLISIENAVYKQTQNAVLLK